MQIKNQLISAYRIIPVVLLLGILSSAFDTGNVSAVTAAELTGLSQDLNLDDDASKWGVFTEVPTPGTPPPTWALNNVSSPSLDGRSLRCALTGGHPYSNVHCYRNLTADPTSQFFTLSMLFYYQPASTFNNVGGPSVVQALEFTMNKWNQGLRYEWALQWDNVDTGAPKWRYWGRETPGEPLDWVDLGIVGSLAGQKWHNLELEGQIVAGQVHYESFTIDGHQHTLNITVSPASSIEPDKLAIGVQLDGNSTQTPYELFVDQVAFRHLNTPTGEGNWDILGVGAFLHGAANDIPVPADYNGDGKDDVAVFRESNSTWYIYGVGPSVYGTTNDIPVVADYNGDGRDDIAVFRESNSTWYIRGVGSFVYGTTNDIPVVGDYNGDGRDDIAVFRESNSTWYIRGIGPFQYGTMNDTPVVGDYNGDGKDDIAVFRPSNNTWYIRGVGPIQYGQSGDIPVVGDYNGDGRDEIAVFRPANGTWYIRGIGAFSYGTASHLPIPADYNGDGKDNIAVFRP